MTDNERVAKMLADLYPGRKVLDLTGRWGQLRLYRHAFRSAMADLKARALHPLGLHTWIPLEQWDTEADTIQFDGYVCWVCERRA